MIQLNQVSKRYPDGFEALKPLSLNIQPHEMVFLTGHSGAGKSTLLKLLALLERPSSGQMIIQGRCTQTWKTRDILAYRRQIGIAFQSPRLLWQDSVFENVALPLRLQSCEVSVVAKRVHAALERVGLSTKQKLYPTQLSLGEQQRVGIARAIVHKPWLLLADEPTGNLDPVLAFDMMKLFEQFNQMGMTVLIATHDLALIARMRYRLLILNEGQLC